jgi:aminoglycoside phosphotransferase (APT) family kinase protein
MEFRPIEREPQAFQRGASLNEIAAMCRRILGPSIKIVSADELGGGQYNNTYRINISGREQSVVLRVAPEPVRQFISESQLMRNEYASAPWLTALASMTPRILGADWSHEVIGRDFMVQSYLSGVPAPDRLGDYPRSTWPGFFRQIGDIARDVHAVRGLRFGPVADPKYSSWSEAVTASLELICADIEGVGLDACDIRKVIEACGRSDVALDDVVEPRMLAGDLWTVNVMLDATAVEPLITGVFDLDRTWWGDPAADWTIRMAAAKPGTERDAFWESYGPQDRSPAAVLRSRVYEARHLGAIRLERHRLGNIDGVRGTYDDAAAVLNDLS